MSVLNIRNGLFRPAPDTQALATGSQERLRITSTGDIGIGTLTPLERLEVDGGVRIGFSGNNNAGTIRWTGTAMEYNDGTQWLPFAGSGGSSLWSQNGSDIYYNTGKVGIGTTSPNTALQVAFGNVRIGEITPAGGTSGSGEGRRLYFSGGPSFVSRDSENSDPLWIARFNDINDTTRLRINVGDNPDPDDGLEIGFQVASAGAWVPNFFFGTDGNFGIQTTAPSERLDVNGQARIRTLPTNTSLDRLVVADSTGVLHVRDVASLGGGSLWDPVPTAPTDIFYGTGKVGIGTALPITRLHVDDGPVLFSGSGSPTPPVSGGGTRFMYLPGNAGAVRSGTISGSQWDNIGDFSVAMGQDVTATGKGAIALGNTTSALNENTTAIGLNSIAGKVEASAFHGGNADGDQTLVMGYNSQASGNQTYVIGQTNIGEGPNSYIFGQLLSSQANGAHLIGAGDFRSTGTHLVNNFADSLMIGYLSDIPTLFISPAWAGLGSTGTVAIANTNPVKDYTLDIAGNTRMRNVHVYEPRVIQLNNANPALPTKTTIEQTDMTHSHLLCEMSISGDIGIEDGLFDGQVLILSCTSNGPGSNRVDIEGTNIVETRRIALNSRPYHTYMIWCANMPRRQGGFGVWMFT